MTREEQTAFTQVARDLHTRTEDVTQWIEPRLCCRVQYRDITEMHQLKQTRFRGFLLEKSPEDCWWQG